MTLTTHVDREELMAWLDAETPPVRSHEIDGHVASCDACRGAADELRAVSAALAAWTIESAPAFLAVPGASTVEVASGRRRGFRRFFPDWRRWTWGQWAAPLGAAVAVVLVVLVGLQRAEPESELARRGQLTMHAQMQSREISPSTFADSMGRSSAATLERTSLAQSDGPLIVKNATIRLTVDDVQSLRVAIEQLVRDHTGSVSTLRVSGDAPGRRTLSATLRAPAARLDAVLVALRALGDVRDESQSNEDITVAHRDLAIRLANARVSEQRLNDLLASRAGNLKDVLDVERERARVRGEIEQMSTEERAMQDRAALSTIKLEASERYQPEIALGPVPIPMRLSNALVDGIRNALDSMLGVVLVVLEAGPTLLIWSLILGPAIWYLWKRHSERRSARQAGR